MYVTFELIHITKTKHQFYLDIRFRKGEPFIYGVLDWKRPEKTIPTIFALLIFGIFAHVILFWIYKLRVFIQQRYFTEKFHTNKIVKIIPSNNLEIV